MCEVCGVGVKRSLFNELKKITVVLCVHIVFTSTTHTHPHTYAHTHTHTHTQLTRLLHKPLLSYIREKFSGRLLTIKPDQSVRSMTAKEIRLLNGDVFAAASTMNLVLLDSDASYPGDFEGTKLHPQFIYVKISRQKVC